jgi:hypothetical protein
MPPTDEGFSRRARILKRVLQWVNQDRFEDYDSWMLFGNRGADTSGEQEELYKLSKPEDEPAYEILGDVQRDIGEMSAAKRTSLEPHPPKILGKEAPADWRNKQEPPLPDVVEYLDAHYSSELLGKLDKLVERAVLLGPHEVNVSQVHDPIRAYFKEVHNCFLYGLPIACAVLCRALLEAALKAKYEPQQQGTVWKSSKDLSRDERQRSTILRSLDRALQEGVLDGSRVEAGENVKEAGDEAIHRLGDFRKRWGSDEQLRRLVEDTRKVLEDSYRATHAT